MSFCAGRVFITVCPGCNAKGERLFFRESVCCDGGAVRDMAARGIATGGMVARVDARDAATNTEAAAGAAAGAAAVDRAWYERRQKSCILALAEHCEKTPSVRESGNVALSPLSIIGAMAMACRGAVGSGDLEHYCWPCTEGVAGPGEPESGEPEGEKGALEGALTAVQAYVGGMPPTCQTLNILLSDSEIKQDFKEDMARYFNAEQFSLAGWEDVNRKVSGLTGIATDTLSRQPEATTLIQAIFFRDEWQVGFDQKHTRPMSFQNEDGVSSRVSMMHLQHELQVISDAGLQAVRLPYKTPGLAAWFVMGRSALDADQALRMFLDVFPPPAERVAETKADLRVPRFKAAMDMDLKRAFGEAEPPITSIFEPGHLGNMSEHASERFSSFKHTCSVHVDEQGTVAGAVTVVSATRGARPPPRPSFAFDRTFWMLIATGAKILFVAKVDQPAAYAR